MGRLILTAILFWPLVVLGDFTTGLDAYKNGNYATAQLEFRNAAETEQAGAQYYLGVMYYLGRGVAEDEEMAAKWFQLAAEHNHAEAQFNLAMLYLTGDGVTLDAAQRRKWLQRAARNGLEYFDLERLLNGELVNVCTGEAIEGLIEEFKMSADRGDPEASLMVSFYLGCVGHELGLLKWLRRSADQGHAESQHLVAGMYDPRQLRSSDGRHLPPQDLERAISWYRRAAEQGYYRAQYELARAYNDGEGVSQNLVQAHAWFSLAAAEKDGPKASDLPFGISAKSIEESMSPQQVDEAKMLRLELCEQIPTCTP